MRRETSDFSAGPEGGPLDDSAVNLISRPTSTFLVPMAAYLFPGECSDN